MNLSQALKEKKRLAGEMGRIQSILQRENSKPHQPNVGQGLLHPSKAYLDQLYTELVKVRAELIRLKAGIARANVGVVDDLFKLSELKAQITWVDLLNTREGLHAEDRYSDNPKEVNYVAYVNDMGRDVLKVDLQRQINKIQDQIDNYNLNTEVVLK